MSKPSHPVIYASFQQPGDLALTTTKKKTVVVGQKTNKVVNDNDYEESFKVKKVSPAQSKKINDFRTKFNFTRDELSKAIGVNSHIVASYENGSANFNPGEWTKINNGVDKLIRDKAKECGKK